MPTVHRTADLAPGAVMAAIFQAPNLGPCCACGCQGDDVANIIMLHRLAPTPGTGWGCMVCNLPANGAIAVLCNACLNSSAPLRFVVSGLAADQQRIPIEDLPVGEFKHDEAAHRSYERHAVSSRVMIDRTNHRRWERQ